MLRRLLPVALALVAGCGSVSGVSWRADSSGFIYSDQGGSRVVEFDLNTTATRIVLTDAEAKTGLPAFSPDGKRVAVARVEYTKGKQPRVQVRIYSSDGKEVKRSAWFERKMGDPAEKDKEHVTYLHWPTPDRILLLGYEFGIYDLTNDRLISAGDMVPWPFGTSPIRPDGMGCLAVRGREESLVLFFLEWDGTARNLGVLPRKSENGLEYLAEWDGDIGWLMIADVMYEVDTARKTVQSTKRRPPVLKAEGKLEAYHVFPGGKKALCAYRHEVGMGKSKQSWQSVEVHDLALSTRKRVLKKCSLWPFLFPSPDRKVVALKYNTGGSKDPSRLLVVGADGKVISDLQLEN